MTQWVAWLLNLVTLFDKLLRVMTWVWHLAYKIKSRNTFKNVTTVCPGYRGKRAHFILITYLVPKVDDSSRVKLVLWWISTKTCKALIRRDLAFDESKAWMIIWTMMMCLWRRNRGILRGRIHRIYSIESKQARRNRTRLSSYRSSICCGQLIIDLTSSTQSLWMSKLLNVYEIIIVSNEWNVRCYCQGWER